MASNQRVNLKDREVEVTVVTLKLGDRKGISIQSNVFFKSLDDLIDQCCEGGTVVGEVPMTCGDEEKPLVIYRVIAFKGGRDISISFLVKKENIYFVAYRLKEEGKWLVTEEFKEEFGLKDKGLKDRENAGFSGRYVRGAVLDDLVGTMAILNALDILHNSTSIEEKREAFQCLCHHIAEACRFQKIRTMVGKYMVSKVDAKPGKFGPELRDLMRTWKKCSRDLIDNALKVPFDAGDGKELYCGLGESMASKKARAESSKKVLHGKREHIYTRKKNFRLKTDPRHWRQSDIVKKWIACGGKGRDNGVLYSVYKASVQPSLEKARRIIKNSYFYPLKSDLSSIMSYAGVEYEIALEDLK